jgi:hypothetical protein
MVVVKADRRKIDDKPRASVAVGKPGTIRY